MQPTAKIYIDGLNLYRRRLEFNPHLKWLNVFHLCQLLLPTHRIIQVRYFTARVLEGASDTRGPIRQSIYWRALKTLEPDLSIHEGKMSKRIKYYPLYPKEIDENGAPIRVRVKKIEEKGSDVALAAFMVHDAAVNPASIHVLFSNDSDFAPVLELIQNNLGVATGLFLPTDKPSNTLLATKPLIVKTVSEKQLLQAQFASTLKDSNGSFHRPDSWN